MDEYKVKDGLWGEGTEIAWVGKKRHTIIFPSRGEASIVTYCNNCGSPYIMASRCGHCGEDMRDR